jgi:hypothetical protein
MKRKLILMAAGAALATVLMLTRSTPAIGGEWTLIIWGWLIGQICEDVEAVRETDLLRRKQ